MRRYAKLFFVVAGLVALLLSQAAPADARLHFRVNIQRMENSTDCSGKPMGKMIMLSAKKGHNCHTWKRSEMFYAFGYGVAGYLDYKAPKREEYGECTPISIQILHYCVADPL